MEQLGEDAGGPERRAQLLAGQGVGLILKSLAIKYRVRTH